MTSTSGVNAACCRVVLDQTIARPCAPKADARCSTLPARVWIPTGWTVTCTFDDTPAYSIWKGTVTFKFPALKPIAVAAATYFVTKDHHRSGNHGLVMPLAIL